MQSVIDEMGTVHDLSRMVGKGGQGEVWLTDGGRRIVKLVTRGGNPETLRRQFAFIRRLDLAGLHVAKPHAILRLPHVGYVADFLTDMVSIEVLLKPESGDFLPWYIKTGSLRRRLRLLAHAGEALAGLHARGGVIYADLSPANVFISESAAAQEAWLIDLDNLSHESDPNRAIFTRGYGAPEVFTGTAGCTTYSDAWAFAVLVWKTLTLNHPLIGDMVDQGAPELEDSAYSGELPWVNHPTDERNRCSTGLSADLVLGSRIMKLARDTFERGLLNRTHRPSIATWVEALHSAADKTMACQGCKGTFLANSRICPWCDEPRPAFSRVLIRRWQPGHGIIVDSSHLEQLPLTEEGLRLPRRTTLAMTGVNSRETHVTLTPVERGISVQVEPGQKAWVAEVGKADQVLHPVPSLGTIVPTKGWMVFFESPELPQRVALLGGKS